jgi:hypothetical protein
LIYHERIVDRERTDLRPHLGTKRLIAYREGTLTPAERDAVQEHLSLCARCMGLLRELRDFEAAAAEAPAHPDPLREEAWTALVRRLPEKAPALRQVAPLPRRRSPFLIQGAIAALLLAVVGLSVLLRVERRTLEDVERRLALRNQALAGLQRTLAETGRQLDAAHGRIQGLEKERARTAGLASELEEARSARVASASVEVSLAPRFVLRGQEPAAGEALRGGGAVNRVKPEAGSVTAGIDLPDSPIDPEIRLELTDRAGTVVWSDRLPGDRFGDNGATVTLRGLRSGLYRLRIEGLRPGHTRFLAEYALDVAR